VQPKPYSKKESAMRTVILRRGLVALFAAAVSFGAITQAQADTLRIGYQKYGTLVLLKAKGTLEKRFADQGVRGAMD
jgi:sulfonate transport system substrate-binding protein